MSAKIAIITVNYNNKVGLQKTITSVLNQTFKEFEYIVIDGDSNDGSKEIIEQNKVKINYWVSEKDSGVYNAMNKGIRAANSDFIIFMNSGDVFSNSIVLSQVEKQLTNEYDILYGDCFKVKSDGYKKLKTYPEKLSFSFFYSSTLNHQSTFIRKSLFEKFFYYNENYKITSDWEFFIYTICKENVPYKYLGFPICDFDFTGVSSSGSHQLIADSERKEVINKHFKLFEEDYIKVSELNSKRFNQIFYIQKYPLAWKILKAKISVILLFLPKMKK